VPLYEFHCAKCHCDSELLVRVSTLTRIKCPHCHSTRVTKKFSLFASHIANPYSEPSSVKMPRKAAKSKRPPTDTGHRAGFYQM
jgi:putative FmdB family regulatory protein